MSASTVTEHVRRCTNRLLELVFTILVHKIIPSSSGIYLSIKCDFSLYLLSDIQLNRAISFYSVTISVCVDFCTYRMLMLAYTTARVFSNDLSLHFFSCHVYVSHVIEPTGSGFVSTHII